MNHEMQILSGTVNGSSPGLIPLPPCRAGEVNIRPATLAELPFIDSLQKLHTKQVGWMPTKQLEGKIAAGHVLIAEEKLSADCADDADLRTKQIAPGLSAQSAKSAVSSPLGYCIGHDQYFKRDDVGIIYQMNVLPGKQRGLIGASLLKAQFERSAYGCKLYCCWCAQDIAANHFWESMGFVPLAFRAGSRGKDRVHIFWQKRIRQGDTTTPWWFPSKTDAGAIREDRIVLPIPPGVRWSDAMPRVLPGERDEGRGQRAEIEEGGHPRRISGAKSKGSKPQAPVPKRNAFARNGMWYDIPKPPAAGAIVAATPQPVETGLVKMPRVKPPRVKIKADPKLIAMARELRDRWLEEVNAGRYLPASAGKYEVSRAIASATQTLPLLEAA